MSETLNEFLSKYNADGSHPVTNIDVYQGSTSPFIIVNHGRFSVVINPLAQKDHLSLDVHSFVDGDRATGGVLAMTRGLRHKLPDTGSTSHNWPSASLVAVLVGHQAIKAVTAD